MKSVNRVTLLGAVGKDPEIRFTAQGMCIASFSLATSEKKKDKDEVTQWHNCVAFGKLGEIVEKYVVKGTKLYADGTITYQTYEKDGVTRYVTKIIVNDVSLLSSPISGSAEPKEKKSAPPKSTEENDDFEDDDIPF